MKKIFCYIFCISIFLTTTCFATSLWDDNNAGLYSRNVSLKNGDSVKILIDEKSAISYKNSTKSTKTNNVNINGGEYSALINFLPNGTSEESGNSDTKDESNIKATIVATVTSATNNNISLSGRKVITVNNKSSVVEIQGNADTKYIKNSTIVSSDLQNLSLKVTTLLSNENNVLAIDDILTQLKNPDATDDTTTETKITDEKRKELYLQYVNQILNLIY